MSMVTTNRSLVKADPGSAVPEMFARYRSRVEEELFRLGPTCPRPGSCSEFPTDLGSSLYTLLRYHLGWADPSGLQLVKSTFQGKALRPVLCLFACEALGGDLDRASPAAVALELIHNFSLIHDDIQDEDLERRHQATVWHVWGVPKALVAGNGLQSVGDLALLQVSQVGEPPETTLEVSRLLTESYLQMILGQCLDIEFERRTNVTTRDYLEMIAYKTGALIRSGLEIGALLATGDQRQVRAFANFGTCLGQAFQIRDDALGIWGNEANTGKPAGNDIRRRKKSFPIVFALERAGPEAQEELQRVYRQERLTQADVTSVMKVLEEVEAEGYSQQIAEKSAVQAMGALQDLPLPPWAKNEAEELVEFLSRRQY